jgi:hypothetical protein
VERALECRRKRAVLDEVGRGNLQRRCRAIAQHMLTRELLSTYSPLDYTFSFLHFSSKNCSMSNHALLLSEATLFSPLENKKKEGKKGEKIFLRAFA